MSAPVTAASAVAGEHYLDASGHLVRFVGPSARHAGMFSIVVLATNRPIDSVPSSFPLTLVTAAEIAARQAVDAIKGQPREVLEPRLVDLDDDALDLLITLDSRMWVAQAVTDLLDRRRIAVVAPVVAPVIAPTIAPTIAPIAPEITIVAQADVTIEEIPLVAPTTEAPPWADPPVVEQAADVAPPATPAPVVVKVRRPRDYAEKLGALGYPVDVIEAMTAETMRAILADGARYAAAEPATVAHADVANTEDRPAWFLACPKCDAEVYWSCSADAGETGTAHCSKSGRATTLDLSTPPSCDWTGRVRRIDAYAVEIVAPEAAPVEPAPPPESELGPSSIVWPSDEAAPTPPIHAIRFLAERGVDLEGDDLDRFDLLVGSVRDCAAGIRGTEARHLPLIDAALVWAQDHDAPATVVALLEKRARQLRGEPAPRPAKTSPRAEDTLTLSSSGVERVSAIRKALAELHAAIPGYVAAMEAVEALAEQGVVVRLSDLGPSRS